ncbi:hypothetical protein NDU88_002924 [Pleurodeles waltl]|uniref:Uncharacterized protein n=1 Tax=Pleurodeles waltl TaxID=8319 RepID=A0AAV7P823_PLEWA|nr:hypothetical protein NDU88_002924 [Pleurodeles waltl]
MASLWGAPQPPSAISHAPPGPSSEPRTPSGERAARVPSFGHLRFTPLHLRPGGAQSRLRFFPEEFPGFRPPALGITRPVLPHQSMPVALARPRLLAPPEAPAHRGGKGRRPASEQVGRICDPAGPRFRAGTRPHPGPVPSSAVAFRH